MPMRSKAQNAAMHAAASGNSTIGIPKKVAQKFVSESHGQNVKALPKVAAPGNPVAPKRRGMESLKPGDYRRR